MRFFEEYVPGNRKLNPGLLWDYDINQLQPQMYRRLMVTRVIQMGRLEDFYAAFDMFGGIEGFVRIAQNEVSGLTDKELNFICCAFDLKKEQTQCYRKAQLRQAHLHC